MREINKRTAVKQQISYYNSYLKIESNPRYKKVWDFLFNNISDYKNKKILDIGCADGGFSEILVKKGFDCYGLEITEKAIAESTNKGIKVKRGSFLERFPFKDETFDIIFAGEVIEHTIDDDGFLQDCYRVLKIDGYLIITTPNLVSLGNRLLMLFGKMPRFSYSQFHYRIYNLHVIREKVLRNNFKIIRQESSYILVSTFFNQFFGRIGELLGSLFLNFGEHIIVYAQKDN